VLHNVNGNNVPGHGGPRSSDSVGGQVSRPKLGSKAEHEWQRATAARVWPTTGAVARAANTQRDHGRARTSSSSPRMAVRARGAARHGTTNATMW
jgi:hypothetical protein